MTQSSFHVAVIMDGNGRWATRSGLPRVAGHKAGADALRRVVSSAPDYGVTTLTAYAFSADNWTRPSTEVSALMALLSWHLESECARLSAEGIRTSVIGRRDRIPPRLLRAINRTELETAAGDRLHLRIAIDYSSRDAIQRAALEGPLSPAFEEQSPPVDLLIRTGGEQRLSDFLLWECAYAELLFVKTLWPDFGPVGLCNAVAEFSRRDRRFGALPAPPPPRPAADRWLR